MWIRKRGKTAHRCLEKTHTPTERAALQVVIRGGELNESLQILLELGLRDQPELFPRFMRFPELARVEVRDAANEQGGEFGFGLQSPARVPFRSVSHIAVVKSAVVPVPPMSRVRCSGPDASSLVMASKIRFAAFPSPM